MAAQTRILSWNVNGVRAAQKKGFLTWLAKEAPDIICLQETKALPEQLNAELRNPVRYDAAWNSAVRKGYSGVATFSKTAPVSISRGFGVQRFDDEGRVLETEFERFTLFNIYFPNGKMNDERLRYKMDFYEASLAHFKKRLAEGKRLIVCGDYNTAHQAIDLARPEANENTSGFLPMERAWMDKLVRNGFMDTFRAFHDGGGHYSWWDMKSGARARNVGWRIDYFFVSENLRPEVKDAFILPEVTGSDHCPVGVVLSAGRK